MHNPLISSKKRLSIEFVLGALLLILIAITYGIPLIQGHILTGRDWMRYWHPLFMQFQAMGTQYGPIWLFGGGMLPYVDPSTFGFDFLFLLTNSFASYPMNLNLYVLLLILLSCYFFASILKYFNVDSLLVFAGCAAYIFSGLSISVTAEQFIPLYFYIPIAAGLILYFLETKKIIYFILSVLAVYHCAYTSVPNIAFLIFIFFGISYFKKIPKSFLMMALYVTALIIVPMGLLYYGVAMGQAPFRPLVWFRWSFHPVRLISFFLPDLFNNGDIHYWMNTWEGTPGSIDPYFSSLLFPVFVLTGFFINSKKINNISFEKIKRIKWLVLILIVLSFIGLLPLSVLTFIHKIPIFWMSYPEKFLVGAVPFIIFLSILKINYSEKNEILKALVLVSFFTVGFVAYALYFTSAYKDVLLRAMSNYGLCFLLQFVGLFFFTFYKDKQFLSLKNRAIVVMSIILSIILFWGYQFKYLINNEKLPFINSQDILYLASESTFIKVHKNKIRNKYLYFQKNAKYTDCRKQTTIKNCEELNIGVLSPLSFFSYESMTSFGNFNEMIVVSSSDNDNIMNFKPDYVVVNSSFENNFCKNILKNISVKTCRNVTSESYVGKLQLYELTHANSFSIDESSTYDHLKINFEATYDKIRLPFIPVSGSYLLVNGGVISSFARDPYGIILDISTIKLDKNKKRIGVLEINDNQKILKLVLTTSFILIVLLVMLHLYLIKVIKIKL